MIPSIIKTILKILWNLFAAIGLLVVTGGLYLYLADPFHLRALLTDLPLPAAASSTTATTTPTLTPQQEAALKLIGLHPQQFLNRLTPAVEACAVAALGEQRVAELKTGATPTPSDIAKAGYCIER